MLSRLAGRQEDATHCHPFPGLARERKGALEAASSEISEVHLHIPDVDTHRAIAVATDARQQRGCWPQVILPLVWKERGREAGGAREAGAEFKTAINLIIHDTSHSRTLSSSG